MSPQIDQIKPNEEILEQSIPDDRSDEIVNVQKYHLSLLFIQWVISLLVVILSVEINLSSLSSPLSSLLPLESIR